MNDFRDLLIWQKGMKLVTLIYRETKGFPKDEIYGLTSQLRRCAVSIPSNIAEGFGRHHKLEFVRFLEIARSSLYELQTQIEICRDIELISENKSDSILEQCKELKKMLNRFIASISKEKPKG